MHRKQSPAPGRKHFSGPPHSTVATQGRSGRQWLYHCAQWSCSGCRQHIPGLLSYRFVYVCKYSIFIFYPCVESKAPSFYCASQKLRIHSELLVRQSMNVENGWTTGVFLCVHTFWGPWSKCLINLLTLLTTLFLMILQHLFCCICHFMWL